ncbi:MAG: hypothetical protein MI867_14055, partial [Pseudomonadales bacterium]|nr:hypothetical protein [Pseudomonadales bacterium]
MFNTNPTLIQEHCQRVIGNIEIKSEATIPFDASVMNFLSAVSSCISNEDKRRFPDLAALCFWLRKKHIISYQKTHANLDNQFGLGLVFHIAPNNVPLNFFYSYAVGLLSGNSNIIKLPSDKFTQ